MPFSVKATLVSFQGDAERYPCHSMLEIGDIVIFDGAELKGKMCPDVMPMLANAMNIVYTCGPRYKTPAYYNLFWYSANSELDPSRKPYDGNGFRPINKEYDEPKYHVRCLQDPNAFHWPPTKGRKVLEDVCVQCPDGRTGAIFKVEAFDLATAGHALPYTRREITILDRVVKAGFSWPADRIRELYSDEELNEIYPPITDEMLFPMFEELDILDYAHIVDGKLIVTESGAERVARYKTEIPEADVAALKL